MYLEEFSEWRGHEILMFLWQIIFGLIVVYLWMCCWPRRWFIYYGYYYVCVFAVWVSWIVLSSLSLSIRWYFQFYCPNQNKIKKNTYNNKFTWAHTYHISNRHRSIGNDLLLVLNSEKMYSIKIHCVNRGLNMMDLLHIKTKQNKMRNNNNNNSNSENSQRQNPFYWLMFKTKNHKTPRNIEWEQKRANIKTTNNNNNNNKQSASQPALS